MATRSVRNLVDRALSLIGVFSVGQTSSNEDTNLGLEIFQDLILGLNQDNFLIPFETEDTKTLVADQALYTIGSSGSPDINTTRPEMIHNAFIRSGNTDYNLKIISWDEYRRISLKSTASTPEYLYYNPTMPNGSIYLYPTPNATDVLHIFSKKTFTEATDLTDNMVSDLGIPDSYFAALSYMLADELQLHFNMEKQSITAKAARYRRMLRNINFGRSISSVGIEPRSAYSNFTIGGYSGS